MDSRNFEDDIAVIVHGSQRQRMMMIRGFKYFVLAHLTVLVQVADTETDINNRLEIQDALESIKAVLEGDGE